MDFATLIGVISGIGLVIGSIMLNSGLGLFYDLTSLMIVVGGTIAATFIAYPMKEVFKVFALLGRVFFNKQTSLSKIVEELIDLATKAKKNGILAIDSEIENISDKFLKKGLQMVVDGIEGPEMNTVLATEMQNDQKRHKNGVQLFSDMGKYAPAFGMVGTLIGLIQMLADLNDPSSIGPKMAVALITTFYGAIMANLFFVPMSVKLKSRSQQESLRMQLINMGVNSIRQGDHPRFMEDKLKNLLTEDEQKKRAENGESGKGAK